MLSRAHDSTHDSFGTRPNLCCHVKEATAGETLLRGCSRSVPLENQPEESDQVLEHLDTAVPEVPAPAPEKIRMIGQYDRTISLATCG